MTLTGWNRAGDALILDHLQIWGSPDDDQTWGELDALLRSNWRHPWGGHLRVDATVVDSGAWTQCVHDFCFPRLARRNWAGKGIDGHHPIFAPSRGKVKGARGRLFIIGVDTMHAVVDEPQSFRPSTPAVVAATSPLASALGGKSTCPYVPLAPPVPLALVPQTGLLFSNDRLRRPGGHPEIVLSTLQLHLRAMACREGVAQIQAFARANLR